MSGRDAASIVCGVLAGYLFSRGVIARRAPTDPLSDRQREILIAVAAGRTTKEIALALGITPNSVNTHIRRARATLGVTTRAAAAARVFGQAATPRRPSRSAAASIARTTSPTRSS
ncbi:MAG TPA: helix-turn-helix transcriptional regulator, partial [Candidatus Limnocylindria bacterium]|nr:helix-turn-helix transcriptional regulator [Candidatus Limnocylindria bacterium]